MEQAIVFRHIGDGVYVGFDGFHVIVKANDPQTGEGIYLDPHVFQSLVDYFNQCWSGDE